VNTGLISNLARPDANLTGFIALNVVLESKRVELLKEAIPRVSRAVVLTNPANPLSRASLDTARQAGDNPFLSTRGSCYDPLRAFREGHLRSGAPWKSGNGYAASA
jgi:hypothetical protein